MPNKSNTEIKSCISKILQKNLLKACVFCFSLFSPNDESVMGKVCKKSVPKANPKPLINFCKPKTTKCMQVTLLEIRYSENGLSK